ncbi:MAG: hypothetical protein J6X94_06710 [Lachnospiraceae bacterium]|nr:hypothetical protein [Lachnospiraceae bacterium]
MKERRLKPDVPNAAPSSAIDGLKSIKNREKAGIRCFLGRARKQKASNLAKKQE